MSRIEFSNDLNRGTEQCEGSDGRLNVSSRSDTRAYYISRDQAQAYTVPFTHDQTESGEFVVYLKNDSKTDDLIVSAVQATTDLASKAKLWFVTGTASGGNTVTPTNSNRASTNDADATAREGGTEASGLAGLTGASLIAFGGIAATTFGQFQTSDTVRLGQGDAIALEIDEVASASDTFGTVSFFFEQKR